MKFDPYKTSRYKTSHCKISRGIIFYLIVQFSFILVRLLQTIFFFHSFMQSIIHTMDPNNDFDKVWKQIVYKTLDDNSDEQIMSYLHAMQQQGGNNSQHKKPKRVINYNREDGHL